ncbi:MAG: hypothetical protein M3R24_00285, partial [Chloroflexota bacterium]|nr:hypothetical protein [Chloroflexota bacterium]
LVQCVLNPSLCSRCTQHLVFSSHVVAKEPQAASFSANYRIVRYGEETIYCPIWISHGRRETGVTHSKYGQ